MQEVLNPERLSSRLFCYELKLAAPSAWRPPPSSAAACSTGPCRQPPPACTGPRCRPGDVDPKRRRGSQRRRRLRRGCLAVAAVEEEPARAPEEARQPVPGHRRRHGRRRALGHRGGQVPRRFVRGARRRLLPRRGRGRRALPPLRPCDPRQLARATARRRRTPRGAGSAMAQWIVVAGNEADPSRPRMGMRTRIVRMRASASSSSMRKWSRIPVLVPHPRPSTPIFTCAPVPFRVGYVGHRTFPLPRSLGDGLRLMTPGAKR
jgi:hypothetical protein